MHVLDTLLHQTLKRPYILAADEAGAGKPVVLLHGLASSSRIWGPLVRRLVAYDWRIIAPDLLGFGMSPKPTWNSYTVAEQAQMVVHTLKKRRVRGPIVLVGHSMGCLVAVHLAVRYPGLVSRIILYEPPLFADDPDYSSHMRKRGKYFSFFRYIAQQPQLAFTQKAYLWRIVRHVARLQLTEESWIPFERSLKNTIMNQTTYRELRTIAVPTDIVHGRLDFVVIRTDLRAMFNDHAHITWHTVTDMHGLSVRSATYLAKLINQTKLPQQP